ncbi:hypothetical protein CIHG_00425 [Coccidioides immitis H538.4]|uniref:Uncharacterized protein n=3 Tax=Coccidioides immitis TaxID=5501 RepID=A0A0J8QI02_COCIT|nr:hypothetical protein CIRG_07242 [Coccidioides immitis RMSCC 2394]KMU71989.1 hypothetical protein CISG_00298 [Coccidioides immitis RMSCC 3703]KMU82644.1 hypothetical protein CIHG_00425 [Coccidioides immitis H538.4]
MTETGNSSSSHLTVGVQSILNKSGLGHRIRAPSLHDFVSLGKDNSEISDRTLTTSTLTCTSRDESRSTLMVPRLKRSSASQVQREKSATIFGSSHDDSGTLVTF